MIFVLRVIFELIAPFSLGLIFLLLGSCCFVVRRVKIAGVLCAAGTIVLIFFGYGFFTVPSIIRLENTYHPLQLEVLQPGVRASIRYVIVLGSGHKSDTRLPVTSEIGSTSLYRLVEGIRLSNSLPDATLVLTGGKGFDTVPNAEVVAGVALELGVPGRKMIVESRPENTAQEAALLAPLLGETPFVLVTSAAHMPRAIRIFQEAGAKPLAAPTDYIIKGDQSVQTGWLPTCGNLELSKKVLYEKLASLHSWLIKLMGQTT